jgi:hypothetical protein
MSSLRWLNTDRHCRAVSTGSRQIVHPLFVLYYLAAPTLPTRPKFGCQLIAGSQIGSVASSRRLHCDGVGADGCFERRSQWRVITSQTEPSDTNASLIRAVQNGIQNGIQNFSYAQIVYRDLF